MQGKDNDRAAVNRSRLFIAISMAIFGTIGLFVRNIPLPSAEIALCRAVLAILAIGSYLLVTKQKMELSGMRRELILLIISGIAMGFNWILLFEAYKYTTVSVATLSYYAAPVIITLVSTLLFREEMTKRKLLCFVMSTLGILLITISGGGMSGKGTDHVGILFGLGAAVLYATVVLLNKFIKNVGAQQIHQKCGRNPENISSVCGGRCDPVSIRDDDRRYAFGRIKGSRPCLIADRGTGPHGSRILYVLFLPAACSGTGSGCAQLYRPIGGGDPVSQRIERADERSAGDRRRYDPRVHSAQ